MNLGSGQINSFQYLCFLGNFKVDYNFYFFLEEGSLILGFGYTLKF